MKISELRLPGVVVRMPRDYEFSYVTDDSRKAGEGAVFVARRGHRADGADFAADAYRRGTRVFFSRAPLDLPADAAMLCGESVFPLLSRLYGAPEKRLRFVGITGTKGKSTTAAFLTGILRAAGVPTLLVGTDGIDGVEAGRIANTTPDLITLMPIFARAAEEGITTVVTEVSSQALADRRVDGLIFDPVIFTSFGRDHVGGAEHPTEEAYFAAKRRLFTDFGAGVAIVNADDPASLPISVGVPKRLFVGLGGDLRVSGVVDSPDGCRFSFAGADCFIRLPGVHNARNAALALTAASYLTDAGFASLSRPLPTLCVPGRSVFLTRGNRTFVIDYAHNAMSITALILTLKSIFSGSFYAVIGSVGGRAEERRTAIPAALENAVTHTVLTADDPGDEHPLVIAAAMHAAFRDKSRATVIPDRTEAVKYAARLSCPGDVILLLGKGAETAQKVAGGYVPYSDEAAVAALDESAFAGD